MIPRIDPELRKALARDAEALIGDLAFRTSVEALWTQWYGELMDDRTDDLKVRELVAKLRALRAIPLLLENLKAAPQFAQQGINVRRTAG